MPGNLLPKLHEIKFMLRVTVREQPARLLDKDLRTVCLAAPDTVDWNRVNFVMEVGGGEPALENSPPGSKPCFLEGVWAYPIGLLGCRAEQAQGRSRGCGEISLASLQGRPDCGLPSFRCYAASTHAGIGREKRSTRRQVAHHVPCLVCSCSWLFMNTFRLARSNCCRHTESWKVLDKHMQDFFKIWEVKTQELGDQTVLPDLMPWLDAAMDKVTYTRMPTEEGFIIYFNLTTCGVLSAAKQNFLYQFVTTFLAVQRVNGIAIVVLPNKAGSPKSSGPHCFELTEWTPVPVLCIFSDESDASFQIESQTEICTEEG